MSKLFDFRGAFVALSAFFAVVASGVFAFGQNANDAQKPSASQELRAVWVSTVGNIDYPTRKGLSQDELRREADVLLDRAAELGLNAIFLQVRPMGDAYYPSQIYPRSSFISGKQGVAPDGDFDALAYWVDGAHRRGLQLHAWVNPYRVTTGGAKLEDLAPTNPAVLHPEWTFEHGGKIFLDPGIPEVRDLVVAGMVEIVENYDVDGIHIDDYFYPARDLPADAATFEKYGAEFDNIEDWRRNNVNIFVQAANDAIHKARENCVWSVSPAGIWANKSSHPLGSETRGNQCYFNLFADVRGWIKNEWIDAVVPQIYWHIGFEIADYKTLVDWWSDVVSDTNVRLYIGTAAYRVDPKSKTEAWRSSDELIRQLEYARQKAEVRGHVFFTAKNLAPGKPAGDALQKYGAENGWNADAPQN